MGRNTTTPNPQSLDRFSIGEIQDIQGVANFYDAGTSKWLRSNTFTASSNLPDITKTNIANSGSGADQIVLSTTADTAIANASRPVSIQPIARITASNITCYANCVNGTNSTVTTITSAGPQVVTTGLTNFSGSQDLLQHLVVSDGTKLFHYGFTAAGTMALYTSTNGTTWTVQAMTGVPAIQLNAVTGVFSAGVNNKSATGDGYTSNASSSYGCWGVVWCGARFLVFGPSSSSGGGGVMLAAISSDGYTWTSNATAILGTASQGGAVNVHFERNGNNSWFKMGGGGNPRRYSTDGGVTWATTASNASARYSNFDASLKVARNTTDPAKFIMHDVNNATLSTDSGANFTTDFSFPYSGFGALAYKGSTMLITGTSGTLRISTNDGTTWSAVLLPVGTLASNGAVFADANRFYFFPVGSDQVLTSSDGVTWTIITLPSNGDDVAYTPSGIIAFDSNKVCIVGASYVFITTDGGVTWKVMKNQTSGATDMRVGNAYVTPDGGGYCAINAGASSTNYSGLISATSLTAGGSFYKVSNSTINPSRTNALAYVRVA